MRQFHGIISRTLSNDQQNRVAFDRVTWIEPFVLDDLAETVNHAVIPIGTLGSIILELA